MVEPPSLNVRLLTVKLCVSKNLGTFILVHMSRHARKAVFRVSDQVRHKAVCTTTEDGLRLEIFGFRKKRDCTIFVVKTKVLVSCAVTAQLICTFIFTYAKIRFSHDEAHMLQFMMQSHY